MLNEKIKLYWVENSTCETKQIDIHLFLLFLCFSAAHDPTSAFLMQILLIMHMKMEYYILAPEFLEI